jgi:hypothetical protein
VDNNVITDYRAVMWIDDREARIIYFDADDADEKAVHPTRPPRHLYNKPESTAEARERAGAVYYRTAADALGEVKEFLVTGPSSAKNKFVTWLRDHAPLTANRLCGVESLPAVTDQQLVAAGRRFFKEVWSLRAALHLAALSGDQAPLALPLIRATWPEVDLATWLSFVEFFYDEASTNWAGVLALRDPAGGICGVVAYQLERDLRVGPILAAQLFTAVDLVNSLRTVRALLDGAEERALELGCAGVQIRLHKEQGALGHRLRSLGLSSETDLFWKEIHPARGRN